DSDALLLSLLDLLQNHESTVARLMGAALQLRDIAKQHDQMAMDGSEPMASLAYDVPIWDQMAQVIWTITNKLGLMKSLLEAMAQANAITPKDGANGMGDALAKFVSFKDQLTYDQHGGTTWDGKPGGINGPAINLTTSDPHADPQTPVDHNAPKVGANQS